MMTRWWTCELMWNMIEKEVALIKKVCPPHHHQSSGEATGVCLKSTSNHNPTTRKIYWMKKQQPKAYLICRSYDFNEVFIVSILWCGRHFRRSDPLTLETLVASFLSDMGITRMSTKTSGPSKLPFSLIFLF